MVKSHEFWRWTNIADQKSESREQCSGSKSRMQMECRTSKWILAPEKSYQIEEILSNKSSWMEFTSSGPRSGSIRVAQNDIMSKSMIRDKALVSRKMCVSSANNAQCQFAGEKICCGVKASSSPILPLICRR